MNQEDENKLVDWLLLTATNSDNPNHFAPKLREAASAISRLSTELQELRAALTETRPAVLGYIDRCDYSRGLVILAKIDAALKPETGK